jgi:hypothetical protein
LSESQEEINEPPQLQGEEVSTNRIAAAFLHLLTFTTTLHAAKWKVADSIGNFGPALRTDK